jgi:hypothetical protein
MAVAPLMTIDVTRVPLPPVQFPVAPDGGNGQQAAAPAAAAPQQNTDNILETGNALHLINYIQNFPNATNQDKMFAFFQAYSQILAKGGLNSGICASHIKAKILDLAKEDKIAAQTVINRVHFKEDDRLTETIRKVDYLTNGILGNHNTLCNYTRRLFHHMGESFFNNRRFVVNYAVLGAQLIYTAGLVNALTSDPTDPENHKKKLGWSAVAQGAFYAAVYPVLHISYATFVAEEP